MPKRGSLKSAGKRQERATFLHCSFFDVALQFFACCSAAFRQNDIRTAEKRMLQCNFCSAAFRKKCSATSVFACGMLQGSGLEGWGLGLAERPPNRSSSKKSHYQSTAAFTATPTFNKSSLLRVARLESEVGTKDLVILVELRNLLQRSSENSPENCQP